MFIEVIAWNVIVVFFETQCTFQQCNTVKYLFDYCYIDVFYGNHCVKFNCSFQTDICKQESILVSVCEELKCLVKYRRMDREAIVTYFLSIFLYKTLMFLSDLKSIHAGTKQMIMYIFVADK